MTTIDGGDAGSDFEAFYRASKDRCLRAVTAVTADPDRAEDCTAEAFLRALRHWERIRGHPAPEAWVVRTATNVHRDRYRRRRRLQRLLPVLADTEPVAGPEPPVDPALLAALRSLPRRQREVLAMRVLLAMSGEETAHALGISTGSVGTHLHRALAALRRRLPPEPRPAVDVARPLLAPISTIRLVTPGGPTSPRAVPGGQQPAPYTEVLP